MNKTRLEAFSDGVIAIIITIMVLELKVPHGEQWADLARLWPVLLSYELSFIYVGIYWNNHHHMLHLARKVDSAVLWTNLHLLFWLSLIPFTTGWMGENHFASLPVAVYSANLFMCGLAYVILQARLVGLHGRDSAMAEAGAHYAKGIVSELAYLCAIVLALLDHAGFAGLLLAAVALLWFIPDRRIERQLAAD